MATLANVDAAWIVINATLRSRGDRWSGFLSNAIHKLGAVCFEDPGEWISWLQYYRGDPLAYAYPEDEIELAELCGVSVP